MMKYNQQLNDENDDRVLANNRASQYSKHSQKPYRSPLSPSTKQQTTPRTKTFASVSPHRRSNLLATRRNTIHSHTSKISPQKNHRPLITKDPSNVVILGDPKCGKSTLVLTYLNQRLTRAIDSILFETYEKLINFNDSTSVQLQIWDFPGDHDFDRLRPLAYANAKGVIICFLLNNPESFHNVKERWIPEVEEYCPKAYRILIGLGAECRLDKERGGSVPNVDFFQKSAGKLGCHYFECFLSSPRSYTKAFETMALMINNSEQDKVMSRQPSLAIGKTRTTTMTDGESYITGAENDNQGDSKRKSSYHKKSHRCAVM